MATILIYANATNVHSIKRSLVGQAAGHKIIWFSAKKVNLPQVTSYSLPDKYNSFLIYRAFLEPFFLQQVINQVHPDLIHVHFASKGLAALPLGKFHPLVVSIQGGDVLPEQFYRGLYAPFTKYLLDRADCITSQTNYMDSALDKIGHYKEKTRRITWGVDMSAFRPDRDVTELRKKLNIQPNEAVFFDVRRALPFYNKLAILESFAKFLENNKPAKLIVSEMGGDPSYIKLLKQKSEEFGISNNVIFVGTIAEADMPDYYVLSDATISLSPSDGKPQTIMEAMACGSFPIAVDIPHYKGIIENGRTARLINLGNINELVDAMLWVIKHPEERKKAAADGREFVNHYSNFSQQAEQMNEIYQELLDKSFLKK